MRRGAKPFMEWYNSEENPLYGSPGSANYFMQDALAAAFRAGRDYQTKVEWAEKQAKAQRAKPFHFEE